MNVSQFSSSAKNKQRKQRHSLKLGKERRESSKHNYYIISPIVIVKAVIIISDNLRRCCRLQDRGAVQRRSEIRWGKEEKKKEKGGWV